MLGCFATIARFFLAPADFFLVPLAFFCALFCPCPVVLPALFLAFVAATVLFGSMLVGFFAAPAGFFEYLPVPFAGCRSMMGVRVSFR